MGTFTFTASQPISVVALRGLTNERSEFLITTLPVADLSSLQVPMLLSFHTMQMVGGGQVNFCLSIRRTRR